MSDFGQTEKKEEAESKESGAMCNNTWQLEQERRVPRTPLQHLVIELWREQRRLFAYCRGFGGWPPTMAQKRKALPMNDIDKA